MTEPARRFMSLDAALKELKPLFVGDDHFRVGVPLDKFGGMMSWEILASWLLSAAINWKDGKQFVFATDKPGGEGIIADNETGHIWPTARLFVGWKARVTIQGMIEQLIVNNIKDACAKIGDQAIGRALIVYTHADSGVWYVEPVARNLPKPLLFEGVWVVGLRGPPTDGYVYNAIHLNASEGEIPVLRVRIGNDFDSWELSRIH